MIDIDKHLIAYHEDGNDYRYVFSREEVAEIKHALEFYESALKNEDGYLATMCERNGYNKCADDFVAKLKEHDCTCNFDWEYYDEIAEQLKERD